MTSRDTLTFIARRLMAMAVLLVVLSFGVFCLTFLAPGDAVDAHLGLRPRTPELVAALRERYNLDEPFMMQYWLWARDALQFDFGISSQSTLPVSEEIGARLGTSLFLAVYGYILAMLLGIIPGVYAALRKKQAIDRGLVAGAVIMMSMPPFVLGILMLYVFAVLIPIFPASGLGDGFVDGLYHLTLPALTLAFAVSAFLLRHSRGAVIGVLDQDYVTFARARGLNSRHILKRYVLRNALIPVVTISGAMVAFFVIGAVFVESVFSINGLGTLLVSSAQKSDMPMIQGLSLLIAVIIVSANLLADIAYVALDPRIRLGRSS